MRQSMKKILWTMLMTGTVVLAATGCGEKEEAVQTKVDLTFDKITLGEDYTDLKADLKFLTHKTDAVDTAFAEYIREFQKLYPNINIEYEGITDYVGDVTTRLTTGDWGDICMIPTSIDKDELGNYFTDLGSLKRLSEDYTMLLNFSYGDSVYGIPSMGNTSGIVYNKRVFEEAGVTELPKTPEEFLTDLQQIKDNTDSIPLYTNFAAGWTLTAWDAYIDACATGQADFAHNGRVKGKNPFADRGDGTGPYAVYNTLYEAVSRGLTEDDPTTTDWEGSKGRLNNGEIGCMALGSWSITQMQQAGKNSEDIAYMPFPISVNGIQYANVAPDYCYGINCNSSADNQIAAMIYIKWLVEKSGFAESEGGIPIQIDAQFPETLAGFDNVELLYDVPVPEGEENLGNDVNNESELGINVSGDMAKTVVEAALTGKMSMEQIAADWNEKWTSAQEKCGIVIE